MAEEMVEEEVEQEETLLEEEGIDPGNMTEEELDNFLNGEEPGEPEELGEGEESGGEEAGEEDPAGGEKPTGEEDPNKGEKPEGDTEDSPEIKELKDQIAALNKKTANQDKFFDRVGTEIGLLRKKTPEEDKKKLEEIRDAYIEDPVEGHRLMEEYREEQGKTTQLQAEYSATQRAKANREALGERLPDIEKTEVINEIADLMVEDGAPPQAVEAFKTLEDGPFYMDQATLHNLYQRNVLRKENTGLKDENESLKKQVEELKGKPAKMLKNIERATKTKTMSGKSAGGGKKAAEATEKTPNRMSKEELDKVLNP